MKRIRYLSLIAVLALVVAACGTETTDTTEPDPGEGTTAPTEETTTTEAASTTEPSGDAGTIVIGTTDSIANLDSADAYAVHDWEIIRNTGEALTKFVPGTTEIEPGIAESWDVSDDGTVYTFHLREGVTFGDGTALTASDYVRHLERMLNLDGSGGVGGALGRPYIACLTEGETDEEGDVSCEEWAIEAPDDQTVEITLSGAFAYFPQLVSGAPYIPSHPSLPEDSLVEVPDAPFYGVGPWILEDFTVGEESVFVHNPHYYGEPPGVERIIVRYFTEASQMVAALQAGDVDIAWRSVTEPALLDSLAETEGIVSAEVPGGGIRYFVMNHNLEPIDDVNVRKAIASLIDRDEIVDRAFGGNAEPIFSQVPPGFLGATEIFDELYESPNPELAAEFLADSGYSEDNPVQLQIDYPPNRYGGVVADAIQIVQEQLEATGLFEVETTATEWATYLGELIGGEAYAMGFLGWFFDYPDTSNYLEPWTYSGGLGTNVTTENNEVASGLTRPELVDLLGDAAVEADEGTRESLYQDAQEAYADDVVTIPLWLEPERVFYWDHISGDTSAEAAESLNIGPTTDFDWNVLQTSG
jgi:peptide/nickel transport system substrate-binding protein